jgi:hypothetical protein
VLDAILGFAGAAIGLFGILTAIALPLWIEKSKRPSFAFEVRDATCLEPVKYLHVAIINRPLTGRRGKWLLRNTATGCVASLSYEALPIPGEHRPWGVPARWSAKAEPWTLVPINDKIKRVHDDTKLENCFHMDLEPSDHGEVVIAAIKHANDKAAYALSKGSYGKTSDGELRSRDLILRAEQYKLTVIAEAGGLRCSGDFLLHNAEGLEGFYVEPYAPAAM